MKQLLYHSLKPQIVFWQKSPALYYGMAFLLGICISFSSSWLTIGIFFFFVVLLISPFLLSRDILKATLALLLFFCSSLYSLWMIQLPSLPEKGLEGSAILKIVDLKHKIFFTVKTWNYSAKIIHFYPSDATAKQIFNIPVTMSWPDDENMTRPLANRFYLVKGKLKKNRSGHYIFNANKKASWEPLLDSWSLAEWRFQAKQAVNNYIAKKISSEPSASFLSGIITGEFENRLLSFEFSRFGLQHIMAISGFHFFIVAGFLGFLLSLICKPKLALVVLMVCMTAYFLFLGGAPSIFRAWLSCMMGLLALVFEKTPSGLNLLGVTLLTILIVEPEMVRHMGFQFSFLVTAAILMYFSPLDHYLEVIFPKKTLGRVIEMNSLSQWGFIILMLFRQALALSIAVTLAALPMTLYYFQKFPLIGIIYNFFFPWLISLSIIFLIVGLTLDLIHPFLGNFFHHFNECFSQFVLDYTYTMPRSIDIYLNLSMTQECAVMLLGLYFVIGIYLAHHAKQQ